MLPNCSGYDDSSFSGSYPAQGMHLEIDLRKLKFYIEVAFGEFAKEKVCLEKNWLLQCLMQTIETSLNTSTTLSFLAIKKLPYSSTPSVARIHDIPGESYPIISVTGAVWNF